MARKSKSKRGANTASRPKSDEGKLTKGQLRKLNTLKKSVGEDIGAKAFAAWLKTSGGKPVPKIDKGAETITRALDPLISSGKLAIPWAGYLVKRGKQRVIVTRVK